MKNMKMSAKISLVIIAVLAVLLIVLAGVVSSRASNVMGEAVETRIEESTDARAMLVEEYMSSIDSYLATYASAQPVIQMFQNPTELNIATAQDYTENYAEKMTGVEGLYACQSDTYQLVHSVPEAAGNYSVEDETERAEFTDTLYVMITGANKGFFRGVVTSPTTGTQVIVYYYPVFDTDGTALGYVGVGMATDDLVSLLDSLEFTGWDNAYYALVALSEGTYIFNSGDTSLNTTEVTDDAILDIIDTVKAAQSGTASGDAATVTNSTPITASTAASDSAESSDASGDVSSSSTTTTTTTEASETEEEDEPLSGVVHGKSNGEKVVTSYQFLDDYGIVMIVSDTEAELFASANGIRNIVIIISLIIAVVIAVLTYVIVKVLVKDLVKVSTVVSGVAESMDMTQAEALRAFEGREDEVGKVAQATIALTDAVYRAASNLQQRGKQLTSTAQNLASISDQTLTNVNQVESAVHDIAEGATSQASETERASGNVVDIGQQIQDAADATTTIMETSEDMRKASINVTEVIDKLNSIGSRTKEAIEEIYKQTNTTNQSAQKIQAATEIITGIAEETNLLSLNASIEAARAGEQGKGFAVVAGQIQKLAEQSSQSAASIEEVIHQLIEDSNQSVRTMEEVREIMVEQGQYVEQTGEIFSHVREGIDQTLQGLSEISKRTEAMDGARQSVVDVVENLSAIAEENAASTQETSANVTIVNDLMTDISEAATDVSKIAAEMDKDLSVFKL